MFNMLEKHYANPSGMHTAGKFARQCVEDARKSVAGFIGCQPEEVVFTSGGTESINSVINSVTYTQYPRNRIISCLTEHGATLNKLRLLEDSWAPKYNIHYLDTDKDGRFELGQLEELLAKEPHTNLLVTLMAANNETGTIHTNIFKAIDLTHKYQALFHVDAVQIAGKLPIKPYIDAGADFLTISGHKFHAPKGVGVIYIKSGTKFMPTIVGGYQEDERRAGTENVPGIVALGVVAEKMPIVTKTLEDLHYKFIQSLSSRISSCIINGGGVPGTVNVGFKGVHREAMVAKLSQYELYASTGSACTRGVRPSHVLLAMNVSQDHINGSVRFSMSKYTTEEEVSRAIDIIEKSYLEVRSYSKGILP
jgi:cysteine desulfurase